MIYWILLNIFTETSAFGLATLTAKLSTDATIVLRQSVPIGASTKHFNRAKTLLKSGAGQIGVVGLIAASNESHESKT